MRLGLQPNRNALHGFGWPIGVVHGPCGSALVQGTIAACAPMQTCVSLVARTVFFPLLDIDRRARRARSRLQNRLVAGIQSRVPEFALLNVKLLVHRSSSRAGTR
jgi:hypothetical protein